MDWAVKLVVPLDSNTNGAVLSSIVCLDEEVAVLDSPACQAIGGCAACCIHSLQLAASILCSLLHPFCKLLHAVRSASCCMLHAACPASAQAIIATIHGIHIILTCLCQIKLVALHSMVLRGACPPCISYKLGGVQPLLQAERPRRRSHRLARSPKTLSPRPSCLARRARD